MNGKQLAKVARNMFNLKPGQPITVDQLNYVIGMSKPSNYLLQHHTINGKPMTFSVPDHDMARALNHRPWQRQIVDDINCPDLCVIKSRQLGFSEIGVAMMIYWLDIHSYERPNGLYTFPPVKWDL